MKCVVTEENTELWAEKNFKKKSISCFLKQISIDFHTI